MIPKEGYYWVREFPDAPLKIAQIGKYKFGIGEYWIQFLWHHGEKSSHLNNYPDLILVEEIVKP